MESGTDVRVEAVTDTEKGIPTWQAPGADIRWLSYQYFASSRQSILVGCMERSLKHCRFYCSSEIVCNSEPACHCILLTIMINFGVSM